MNSRELSEWMVYYSIEPFGEVQAEYRAALVASMVANTARDPDVRKEPFEATEFMRASYLDELKDEADEQQRLVMKAKSIMGLFGAKKEK